MLFRGENKNTYNFTEYSSPMEIFIRETKVANLNGYMYDMLYDMFYNDEKKTPPDIGSFIIDYCQDIALTLLDFSRGHR